jgi:hypothetical protein
MPTLASRLAGCAVAAVALAVFVGGCVSGAAGPAAVATRQPTASPRPTATSPTPTPTPTPTGPGPMTAAELAWLAAVTKMHSTIKAAFSANEIYITRAKLRSLTTSLGECRRVLRRIGRPTARLRPVFALVNKACAHFDKAAKCFLTAARVGDAAGAAEAGTPAERTQRQAISCGFAGHGDGSNALGDAAVTGVQIKLAAG